MPQWLWLVLRIRRSKTLSLAIIQYKSEATLPIRGVYIAEKGTDYEIVTIQINPLMRSNPPLFHGSVSYRVEKSSGKAVAILDDPNYPVSCYRKKELKDVLLRPSQPPQSPSKTLVRPLIGNKEIEVNSLVRPSDSPEVEDFS